MLVVSPSTAHPRIRNICEELKNYVCFAAEIHLILKLFIKYMGYVIYHTDLLTKQEWKGVGSSIIIKNK